MTINRRGMRAREVVCQRSMHGQQGTASLTDLLATVLTTGRLGIISVAACTQWMLQVNAVPYVLCMRS